MVHLVFPSDPDLVPSGKLPVFGQPRCSAGRMRAYASRRNPHAPDIAEMYLEKAESYGIRGDVAFCQAMLDTQVWTAEPQGPPWKPFAYSIWGGLSFVELSAAELERRTEHHLQRLSAIVDSHKTDEPCWEDLGGTWAVADKRYGQDVVAIWRNMLAWRGDKALIKEDEQKGADDDMAEAALAAAEANADDGLGEEKRNEAGIHIAVRGNHVEQAVEQSSQTDREEREFHSTGQVGEAEREAGRADLGGRSGNRTGPVIPVGRTAEDHIAWLSARAWAPTPLPHPGRKVSWGELARVIRSLEKQQQ